MNKAIALAAICFLLPAFAKSTAWSQSQDNDLYRDESVAGARAAMGMFANGYSRALAAEVFGLKPASLSHRITSAALAAMSYQILSFDKSDGLRVQPLKWNKEWRGYWQGYLSAEAIDIFLGTVKKYNGLKFLFGSSLAAATGVMLIEGENSKKWRYAQDGPLTLKKLTTNRHSYWIHFAGSGGLYWAFSRHAQNPEMALLYTTFFIWMWEVKDGYIRWEDVGFLGGDGFSWADGWAGSIAAAGSYVVNKLLFSEKSVKSRLKEAGNAGMHRNARLQLGLRPSTSGLQLRVDF